MSHLNFADVPTDWVVLNGLKVNGIFDTDASISVISPELVFLIRIDVKPWPNSEIFTADGRPIVPQEVVTRVRIVYRHCAIEMPVAVLKGTYPNLLLGSDLSTQPYK